MLESQVANTDSINAIIYLKDGSKKMVSIISDILHSPQHMIQFISNSNLPNFIETKNPNHIESIETLNIDGIEIDLK